MWEILEAYNCDSSLSALTNLCDRQTYYVVTHSTRSRVMWGIYTCDMDYLFFFKIVIFESC